MRPHPWEELQGGALAARVFLKLAQNLFCNPGWMGAQFSLVAGQQQLQGGCHLLPLHCSRAAG